jgi:hypothetical protein
MGEFLKMLDVPNRPGLSSSPASSPEAAICVALIMHSSHQMAAKVLTACTSQLWSKRAVAPKPRTFLPAFARPFGSPSASSWHASHQKSRKSSAAAITALNAAAESVAAHMQATAAHKFLQWRTRSWTRARLRIHGGSYILYT